MYCSLIALPLLLLFSKCSRAAVGEKIKLHLPIFIYLIPKPITLKALCNEFFDGEIFALRYSVLCTGSKDANRFPKLQLVALFL
jgi:hypothetical protein